LLICGLFLAGLAGWGYWPFACGPTRGQLLTEAEGADRIIVVHGTLGPESSRYGKPAFEIRGADVVEDFLQTVDWVGTTGRCACGGNYRINLYRGDQLLVSLGCHHGRFLRLDPWRQTDVEMTEDSRQAVAYWFAGRGFAGFREVVDDEIGWSQRK
jgi:hypothetical protein